jgi:hypothetical protein
VTVDRRGALGILAVLGALVLIAAPSLGTDPQVFSTRVDPDGLLASLVRAADSEWELGLIRAPALLAGLLVAVAAALALGARRAAWPRWLLVALAITVAGLLLVPAALLAVGLRESSEPWAYTNDSTYQIELAGELVLDGENPYGHDYRGSGLERWYQDVDQPTDQGRAALEHFAYFPGTALTAAAWRLLPAPLDDYRLFVLLATFGLLGAALLFPAPFAARIAAGAVLAANPLAVRAPWFGTADAPSLLLCVLAFALLARGRYVRAAACLGGAVLLKQFALVAVPFFVLALLLLRVPRPVLRNAAIAFTAVVVAGFLPFLVADPGAVLDDTIAYGASTYRIIGYGLAGLLVEAGIAEREGDYPFALVALVVWVPVTAWLLVAQARRAELWAAAAGTAVSLYALFWISRVFQTSYLLWPLVFLVLAGLLFAARALARDRSSSAYTRVDPAT